VRWASTLLVACALAGCGGSAGDLLAIEVSGGFEDRTVRLTVTSDGRGRCGTEELRGLTSGRVIEAREVERELEALAEEGASFGGGEGDRRSYVARTRAGTVRWSEGEPGLPAVLPQAALLARQLESELC
jgi:hypothetical protein